MGAPAASRRWLFGPLPDLLFGCGLLYAVVFATQAVLGDAMRGVLPLAIQPFLTLALGAPHYGATLLRAAEPREGGRTYVAFAIWTGVLLLGLMALALREILLGSLLVTLYVTWSPWHYSAQNFGIAVAFARRRGIALDAGTKRLLRGIYVSSYLLTVIAVHGARGEDYAPVSYRGTAFTVLPAGIPSDWLPWLYAVLAAAFVGCSAVVAARLVPRAGLRALDALGALWVTQVLWFVLPPLARYWNLFGGVDPLAPANAPYTVMWIATFHFVQYLWIASGQRTGRPGGAGPAYFGKALLAGSALWVLPPLLFAPTLLGTLPYDVGLGVLAAALVNLHHFVLDGVIWKSSAGPVARLVRADWTPRALFEPRGGAVLRSLGLAVGAGCLLVAAIGYWEAAFALTRASESGDYARARTGMERLAWLGRDSPRFHTALARIATQRGDPQRARRELERSIAMHPTAEAYTELGAWWESQHDVRAAIAAHEQATLLGPNDANTWYRLGIALLRDARPEEARRALARAAALVPEDRIVRKKLEQAERELREAGAVPRPGAAEGSSRG
jgi:tetratricopeptide (TPR) repeat protein